MTRTFQLTHATSLNGVVSAYEENKKQLEKDYDVILDKFKDNYIGRHRCVNRQAPKFRP